MKLVVLQLIPLSCQVVPDLLWLLEAIEQADNFRLRIKFWLTANWFHRDTNSSKDMNSM